MDNQTKGILKNADTFLLVMIVLLVCIGLLSIFSAEYSDTQEKLIDFQTSFGKQLMWVGISLFIFFVIMFIDARVFMNFSYFLYAGTLLLLVATLAVGKEVYGSKSWIQIGGFSLQASEFAKFGTALALAHYLDKFEMSLAKWKQYMVAFAIIGAPVFLIMLQNDFGSALVFGSFILLFYRQGLSPLFLIIPGILIVLFLMALLVKIIWIAIILFVIGLFFYLASTRKIQVLWFSIVAIIFAIGFSMSVDYMFTKVLKPHQRARINVLLGKEIDLKGVGYQTHQSLISIGSGGVMGKGFLKGTQTKFDFIPKQTTDFIFCTIAEEYGLWGSVILILIFCGFLWRIIYLCERQKFRFTRNFGYGIAGIFMIHFFANIAMVLGIFPVIGIPLPFVSYGGSSLMGFVLMTAVFIKLDADFKHYFN